MSDTDKRVNFARDGRRVYTPWGINRLGFMIGPGNAQGSADGKMWFRAVPEPYEGNIFERLRAAWWVLTGRAHAVIWPELGELEESIGRRP